MTNVAPIGSAASPAPKPKSYHATIYPEKGEPIDSELAETILALEKALDMQIWVFAQCGEDHNNPWNSVSGRAYRGFRGAKGKIERDARVGLLIQSPGGIASFAYKIVRLFQRRTPEFYTLVPLYAKSAATLMALGGKEIVLGEEAELGPLDVQLYDANKENWDSALNAVQSLERLNAYAMLAFDNAMQLFMSRTRKKADVLMPLALEYAIRMVTPLVQKIDTIELTRQSRELKVAEEYGVRLMRENYSATTAASIASSLVERYPAHEFAIDRDECVTDEQDSENPFGLGLHVMETLPDGVEDLFARFGELCRGKIVIGRVVEATP